MTTVRATSIQVLSHASDLVRIKFTYGFVPWQADPHAAPGGDQGGPLGSEGPQLKERGRGLGGGAILVRVGVRARARARVRVRVRARTRTGWRLDPLTSNPNPYPYP